MIATGGLAPVVVDECASFTDHQPWLTLLGLEIGLRAQRSERPGAGGTPLCGARRVGAERSIGCAAMSEPRSRRAAADDLPEQMRVRREKRERLLDDGAAAYPLAVPRTHTLREIRATYDGQRARARHPHRRAWSRSPAG